MTKLLDALKIHSVAIAAVLMGVVNIINTLKACLPPAWVSVVDIILPIVIIAAHHFQKQEALITKPPKV